MNPYELYPTPQEVDAWTDEIWAAAQAPYTVTEEPLPETYIGPLQAMGADRFLRFETGGDFFYALFQPALGGPGPWSCIPRAMDRRSACIRRSPSRGITCCISSPWAT